MNHLLAIHQDFLAELLPGGDSLSHRAERQWDVEAASLGRVASKRGSVAIVPIRGVIGPDAWRGDTVAGDVEATAKSLAADDSVKAVIFDFDTPGGYVQGVPEAAAAIAELTKTKSTIAFARGLTASAGYWLASQAKHIYLSDSGSVGSIGVVAMHANYEKALEKHGVGVTFVHAGRHKVEGNPYQPLTEESKAEIQRSVNATYDQFVAAIVAGRKVDRSTASGEQFGEGRMFRGKEAVQRKMADGVQSFDSLISEIAPTAVYRVRADRAAFEASCMRAEIETK